MRSDLVFYYKLVSYPKAYGHSSDKVANEKFVTKYTNTTHVHTGFE